MNRNMANEAIPTDLNTVYNYAIVRKFTLATLIWGILGMGMGVFIAAQLVWPELNFGLAWTSFGRIRPIHTNLVIFAFGGGALFATSFYVVQRTSRVRLVSDGLANFVFWGWQFSILAMIVSYPLGYTTSKEYAEMEWPIAVFVAVVWLAYAYLFFGTIAVRKVKHGINQSNRKPECFESINSPNYSSVAPPPNGLRTHYYA